MAVGRNRQKNAVRGERRGQGRRGGAGREQRGIIGTSKFRATVRDASMAPFPSMKPEANLEAVRLPGMVMTGTLVRWFQYLERR
eukprot:762019-Hanusia_phi.AAC.3